MNRRCESHESDLEGNVRMTFMYTDQCVFMLFCFVLFCLLFMLTSSTTELVIDQF